MADRARLAITLGDPRGIGAEVVAAADEHGMTMVFTGRRTFRH